MDNWSKLSIKDRAELINLYLDGGVMSISQMRDHYNSFEDGGYKPSESIKRYIKSTEAFRSKWYKDGNGVPTVGYGFTGEYFKKRYPNGMTQEEADREFERVISNFASLVKRHTPNYDSLSQNQRDSLLSYMYNVGPGNYTTKSPKFQRALRDKDWNAAAQHMDIGYNDKKNPGLRKRRDYERNLFLNSTSPSSPYSSASFPNYYEETKNNVAQFSLDPAVYSTPKVGMPSLYYAQSSPYEDIDFSSSLPEFNPEYTANLQTYPISQKHSKMVSETSVYKAPTNEEIIGDLWNRLDGYENIFDYGGDTSSPIGKPFIYWNPEPITEDVPIPMRAPIDLSVSSSRNNSVSNKQVKIKNEEQKAFVDSVFNNLGTSEINFKEVPLMAQSDATRVAGFTGDKVVTDTDVYKPLNSRLVESKILKDGNDSIIQQVINNLKSEDEVKGLQKELYEKGYLKPETPKLKAKTKEEIKEIQRRLRDAGYDIGNSGKDKDGVDGIVGSKTRAAWEKYNNEHSDEAALDSVVDGKIGSKTRRAITEYANGFNSIDVEELSVPDTLNLKQYDKVLKRPVSPSFARTIGDGIDDKRNLSKWKRVVEEAKENNQVDEDGIPYVNMNWRVSKDALTRAVSLLPKGLKEDSQKDWVTSDKKEGNVRYPNTWDNPEYLKKNSTKLTRALSQKRGALGLVGQALTSPGRGSIGGFSYRTTPYGIEISDGYEFAASPDKVMINNTQTEAYNDIRSQMNVKYRARNKTSQRYFIPWEVYNKLQTKD